MDQWKGSGGHGRTSSAFPVRLDRHRFNRCGHCGGTLDRFLRTIFVLSSRRAIANAGGGEVVKFAFQAQRADSMAAWGNAPGRQQKENIEPQRGGTKQVETATILLGAPLWDFSDRTDQFLGRCPRLT